MKGVACRIMSTPHKVLDSSSGGSGVGSGTSNGGGGGSSSSTPSTTTTTTATTHGRVEDPVNRLGGEGNTIIKHIPPESKTKQRMVLGMIHLKDSLLPMCRVWSLDFLVDIHIYI